MAAVPSVYDCIGAVSRDIAQTGLAKTRSNAEQKYKFRGIDDVLNALSPLLAKHRLVILPRVLARTVVERTSRSGGALFYVTIEAEFDFVSAADGSTHIVKTYGEAMDSADKATNKAMSAAYKYAALLTFCIPTEGDNDADAVTHEPVAAAPGAPVAAIVAAVGVKVPADVAARLELLAHPAGYLAWFDTLRAAAMAGLPALETAWSTAPKEYRQHLTLSTPGAKDALKVIAGMPAGAGRAS